jgi:antirestriction protein ArdC
MFSRRSRGGAPDRKRKRAVPVFVTGWQLKESFWRPSRRTAMSRHNFQAGSGRTSLYDEITTRITSELEAGRVPWVQPWGTAAAKAPLAMPKNGATGRCYSGINVLILWGSVIDHGFPAQGWVTFRQALDLGGNVRKGERGTTVVYADRFIPDDEKRRARETGEEAQSIPFLKRFTAFNLAQCEGLPDDLAVTVPLPEPGLIEPRVEALVKATGIDFRIGGNRALYMPGADYAQVPPPQAYFEPINWHRTALHELGHYAEVRIMPHGAMECAITLIIRHAVFGIIRAFPGMRATGPPADT